jgi:hypothetical protein
VRRGLSPSPRLTAPRDGARALRGLRRARRRRAYGDIDWGDALYKVYVTALLSAVGVSMLSGWVGGEPVTPPELETAAGRGPAVVGLVVALVVAAGLRSGGRGGPLALQPADVQLVLLAPVPRGLALRGPAVRQLRFGAFAGTVAGMVAGNLAAQRLPGSYPAWVLWGGMAGLIAGLAWTGSALVASGARFGRRWAGVLGAAALAWSVADLTGSTATSPATFLGRLAMSALEGVPVSPVGLALLALPVAGLVFVGGTSLEAARRQAGLAAQLRFALTMQDLRTVILLRRQLAAEGPRLRPWLRMPPARRPRPVWRRDWQGVLRWPATRILRMGTLGATAGLAAAGAWRGTPALVFVSGAALLVAALDSVEGQAQEVDHLVRRDTLPMQPGELLLRHLAAPSVVMLAVVPVGAAGAVALGGAATVLAVAVIVAAPAALAATCGAALSVETGPVDPFALEPFAGVRMFVRSVGPGVLALAGVLPVLAARASVDGGGSAVAGALPAAVVVLGLLWGATAWLRRAS